MAARQPDRFDDDNKDTYKENIGAARDAARDEIEAVSNRNTAVKDLGFDRLARKIEMKYGLKVSGQTLRTYHGEVGLESMSPEYVAFLATTYGFTVEELSPRLAERCAAALQILSEARIRWSATLDGPLPRDGWRTVPNPPFQQTVLSLDFGDFHSPPLVVCRCGQTHDLRSDTAPCAYCSVPTFDEHQVCAGCRELEALEAHAAEIIDLVDAHAQAG